MGLRVQAGTPSTGRDSEYSMNSQCPQCSRSSEARRTPCCQRHEAAEGGGLTASVPVHHQDGRLPASPCHPQLLLVHQLDEVEHRGEGRGLLGPVVCLDHHQVPGQVVALQPQSDGAGHIYITIYMDNILTINQIINFRQ